MTRAARLREVAGLCDTKPRSARELSDLLGVPLTTVKHYTEDLRHVGRLHYCTAGPNRGWLTPRLWEKLLPGTRLPDGSPPAAAPVVNAPLRPRWESGRVIERSQGSVRIIRAEPPRLRWESDVQPGAGVISQDWAARKEGGQPAGWTKYLGNQI